MGVGVGVGVGFGVVVGVGVGGRGWVGFGVGLGFGFEVVGLAVGLFVLSDGVSPGVASDPEGETGFVGVLPTATTCTRFDPGCRRDSSRPSRVCLDASSAAGAAPRGP